MNTTPNHAISPSGRSAGQRASLLVVVMWIVFGLVTLTLYFAHSMTYDLRAADNRIAAIEADEAIHGAIVYVTCVLSNLNSPGSIPDRSSYLNDAVKVGNAHFWLIGRTNQDAVPMGTLACGLDDEASKVNINCGNIFDQNSASNMLATLPRVTPDVAINIMAWASTNTTLTVGGITGAESDSYSRMTPPYQCKNAPFESIEELRLVYNMNIDILYGEDANLNGFLDPNENDGDVLPPSDNQNGKLDPGLFDLTTVYSREPANQTNGQPRVNITTAGAASQLMTNMTALFGQSRAQAIIQTVTRAGAINSPLAFYVASGMSPQEFMAIETDMRGKYLQGLININTASPLVLAALPGMDVSTATEMVNFRQANGGSGMQNSIAWLPQAVNNPQLLSQIGPFITGQSYQFDADIAAVGHDGRGYRRVKVIFDLSQGTPGQSTPVIIYRRDLTGLGWALGKAARDKWVTMTTK